ncbi:hypothetical protein [Microcoleus sp. Pol10D4]|uniref:hypothetical protein n=1 Tax=Microcoleus sp. Pol10D4 TaxID=3055387 RepID=UPI002FD1F21D
MALYGLSGDDWNLDVWDIVYAAYGLDFYNLWLIAKTTPIFLINLRNLSQKISIFVGTKLIACHALTRTSGKMLVIQRS